MAEPAMNRRALLGTAAAMTAAAAAGPLVAGSAQAQGAPPQANAQLPGAFRYKVGSFEVTSLFDGYGTRPMNDQFVVNAPLDQVQEALRTRSGRPTVSASPTLRRLSIPAARSSCSTPGPAASWGRPPA